MIKPNRPQSFFDIISICNSLDHKYSTILGKRRTKIWATDEGVEIKITHVENGEVCGKIVQLCNGCNVEEEINKIHDDLRKKVMDRLVCNKMLAGLHVVITG